MAYPWEVEITEDPRGGFRAVVNPPLPDLELHAPTREELEAEWKDALASHLRAYLGSGKCIPIPYVRIQASATSGGAAESTRQMNLNDLLAGRA
jgi:hypothetical protein